jgi:microsomal dipeptidase-like Zn-dependent dipeptidase
MVSDCQAYRETMSQREAFSSRLSKLEVFVRKGIRALAFCEAVPAFAHGVFRETLNYSVIFPAQVRDP